MSGLILCNRHSAKPYYISDMDINIYSIEELAYFLYNKVYFIEEDFFNKKLISFIENDLNLPKIALSLKYAIGQKMKFSELVLIVIKESRYYNSEEIKSIKKNLELIENQSIIERMKSRADMLLMGKKYAAAYKTYTHIIDAKHLGNIKGNENQSDEFYATVLNSIGVIKTRMFNFDDAVSDFKESYILNANINTAKNIIMAMMMSDEYDDKSDKIKNTCEKLDIDSTIIQECNLCFESRKQEIEASDEYKQYKSKFIYDADINLDEYYDQVNSTINDWKREYRENIS